MNSMHSMHDLGAQGATSEPKGRSNGKFSTSSSDAGNPSSGAEYEQLIDEILGCVRQMNGNPLKDIVDEVLNVVNRKSQKIIIAMGGRDQETHIVESCANTEHFNASTSGTSAIRTCNWASAYGAPQRIGAIWGRSRGPNKECED